MLNTNPENLFNIQFKLNEENEEIKSSIDNLIIIIQNKIK